MDGFILWIVQKVDARVRGTIPLVAGTRLDVLRRRERRPVQALVEFACRALASFGGPVSFGKEFQMSSPSSNLLRRASIR